MSKSKIFVLICISFLMAFSVTAEKADSEGNSASTENTAASEEQKREALPLQNEILFNASAENAAQPEKESDDEVASDTKETSDSTKASDKKKKSKAGPAEIPEKKRPKKPDSEKARLAGLKDEGKDSEKERKETLKFGIESEINDLIKKLLDNDDPRFGDELYDLFQETKSVAVREKIIEYFTKYEDPCLEDYAVTVLNDPYDEKNSTVELVFKYVAAVKTKQAVPAVMSLLESENENYFGASLSCIGEIGGADEAEVLLEYLDRSDLSVSQRQSLMKVLGKIKAEDTWEKLCEIAESEDENTFVRMYAAEAIGAMKKEKSIPVLVKLFETSDPNLRCYVIKGLSYYKDKEAERVIVQGVRDAQYKVRLEAIEACEKADIREAVPFIIYRAKKDSEESVKNKAYEVLAKMNDSDGNSYLIEQIKNEKTGDTTKAKIIENVLKHSKIARSEIAELAEKIASDDKRKPFRYTVGKLLVKYPDGAFSGACKAYLASKDAATVATGLDMFAASRFIGVESTVKSLAENDKAGANQTKAKKILKIE